MITNGQRWLIICRLLFFWWCSESMQKTSTVNNHQGIRLRKWQSQLQCLTESTCVFVKLSTSIWMYYHSQSFSTMGWYLWIRNGAVPDTVPWQAHSLSPVRYCFVMESPLGTAEIMSMLWYCRGLATKILGSNQDPRCIRCYQSITSVAVQSSSIMMITVVIGNHTSSLLGSMRNAILSELVCQLCSLDAALDVCCFQSCLPAFIYQCFSPNDLNNVVALRNQWIEAS